MIIFIFCNLIGKRVEFDLQQQVNIDNISLNNKNDNNTTLNTNNNSNNNTDNSNFINNQFTNTVNQDKENKYEFETSPKYSSNDSNNESSKVNNTLKEKSIKESIIFKSSIDTHNLSIVETSLKTLSSSSESYFSEIDDELLDLNLNNTNELLEIKQENETIDNKQEYQSIQEVKDADYLRVSKKVLKSIIFLNKIMNTFEMIE